MPPKRKAKTRKDGPRPGEFRFRIEAFTPETMPLDRLIAYLGELAVILGEPKDVHLVGIEPGSTVPVLHVEYESIPKVQVRALAVRRGDAPRDPLRAYRRINEMLREDNGRAVFERGGGRRGDKLLEFPGKDETQEKFATVKQMGTLDGYVMRLGGVGDQIPIILHSESKEIVGCYADRHIAKELGKVLFEPVRVMGMGSWFRDAEGVWGLSRFRIQSFQRLDDRSLSDALTKLQSIEVDWGDEAYDELAALRRGRVTNGGA